MLINLKVQILNPEPSTEAALDGFGGHIWDYFRWRMNLQSEQGRADRDIRRQSLFGFLSGLHVEQLNVLSVSVLACSSAE